MSSLLTIENLHARLRTPRGILRPVDGVSFQLAAGETFALLGESGCGKSLTALSIMGLLPPAAYISQGSINLAGEDWLGLTEAQRSQQRGRRVGMIFQEPQSSLNPIMTIGDQIGEPLTHHQGLRGKRRQDRIQELLAQVGIPDPQRRWKDYPHQFSGGMRQRVMIAMALACHPALLIADEPTTALDVTIQAQILGLMQDLQRQLGMGVLLISHDLGVVQTMADRVAVMYAGHLVEQAPRSVFFTNPHHPYSQGLFAALPGREQRGKPLSTLPGTVPPLYRPFVGCRFAERCDQAWGICHDTPPRWISLTDGCQVRCHRYDPDVFQPCHQVSSPLLSETRPPLLPSPPLLEVTNLTIHFPLGQPLFRQTPSVLRAVDGVSLRVAVGQTVALVGESGCGKTTVGKGIARLIPANAGQIVLGGVDLTQLTKEALRQQRRNVQLVFQDPFASLNPRLKVRELVAEGMTALGIGKNQEDRQQRVSHWLTQVGLTPDMADRYPHEFSGGQRQRIAIARALAVEPSLVVWDEPTSALDVSVQAQIINLLKELQDRLGIAYLFITHNISVVEYLAHQVAVMYLGRIVEQGTAEEVLGQPAHPYTQALLAAVPVVEPSTSRKVMRLAGDLPSPTNPPTGCHFHPRCAVALPCCREHYPPTIGLSSSHWVYCHGVLPP